MEKEVYKTLLKPSEESLYKEKGSKFIGYAYPVSSQVEIDEFLLIQKKNHPKARHWCYAWQLGIDNPVFRYNDDGEPGNSAGKPIYGQIQSFDLTNVLVIVVRYFGGTKLGVGGLINAYRTAAKFAFEGSQIKEITVKEIYSLRFEYADMDKVMRIIKEKGLEILSQKMNLDCVFELSVPKGDSVQVVKMIENLRCVHLKMIN